MPKMDKLTPEQLEHHRAYNREWARKNKERAKKNNSAYLLRPGVKDRIKEQDRIRRFMKTYGEDWAEAMDLRERLNRLREKHGMLAED